jgi:hypothetical protein
MSEQEGTKPSTEGKSSRKNRPLASADEHAAATPATDSTFSQSVSAAYMDAHQPDIARPTIATNRTIKVTSTANGVHTVVRDFISGAAHAQGQGGMIHEILVGGSHIYVEEAEVDRVLEEIGIEQFTPANGINPSEKRFHFRTSHITHLRTDPNGACWVYLGEWYERVSEDSYKTLGAAIGQ